MSGNSRIELQQYPQTNLSSQLLRHQQEMIQFLFFTEYDIIYETFQLKHASYLQKRKGEASTKFKSQQISRHFDIASQKLHIRILRDDIDLDKHLSKLQLLWHTKNIPFFHRYYFEKYLFTTHFKNIEKLIINEEKLIRQQQHIYYSITRGINARQSCLRQLKRNIAELTSDDVYEYLHVGKQRLYEQKRKQQKQKYQIQGYKVKQITDEKTSKLSKTGFEHFSDTFIHLSKLTLYVIELIIKWRQYIKSLTHDQRKQRQRIQYYFYDDNYFLKILSDIGFVKVSFLSNFYQFAPKNDPFLLRCILAFQKSHEKTLQHQLLKRIFLPPPDLLPDILAKLEFLSQEYKSNIRSRRVYDLRSLKESNQLMKQKTSWNEKRDPISNIVLKKLQPKRAKSLRTFRIRESQKKQKIIVEFDSPKIKNKYQNVSIPNQQQKLVMERQNSPLKNSIIIEKNSVKNPQEMIDAQMLQLLKQQVVRKIKQDFKQHQKQKFSRNQALQLYIENKVKQAMSGIFPYKPQAQLKLPIQFTTLSIPDDQLASELNRIYKKSISRFSQMQVHEADLLKQIQNTQFVYIIKATIGDEQIGRIVCTYDRQVIDYKIIKVFFIGFYDVSQLELLMLKFVQFLWKYENSYQIVYSFFQPSLNEVIKQLLSTLQANLSNNCLVATKQIYSAVAQVKFIFKRKHKNVNYIPNMYPISMHATLNLLLSQQKVMLQNPHNHKLPIVNYDYLLMQVIRKYVSSDEFIMLKQKINWKLRLKQILDMILNLQKDKNFGVKIKMHQADNITLLNKQLAKQKKKVLEVSDLVKANTIKLLSVQFTLTLPYMVKSVYKHNQQFYRYQIKSKIPYWIIDDTEAYIFSTNERKDLKIVLFEAKQFVIKQKNKQDHLSLYIKRIINEQPIGTKQVEHFWVPMSRVPTTYQQRQDNYISTYRVQDLKQIKKQLLIGDQFEWFCSMQMQNSIKYDITKLDISLQKPIGIGIINDNDKSVIYGRIIA